MTEKKKKKTDVEDENGVPKRDGSGRGIRANRGRGGCVPPADKNARDMDTTTIFEEWIAGCIRKHVKGSEKPKMKQEQCVAAAYKKLRAGKLKRRGSDSKIYIAELDSFIDITEP